jgi:predicted ATPase/DNA-binding CsgD family transcriptional regulator
VTANTVARWERGEQRARHPRALARTLDRLQRRRPAGSRAGDRRPSGRMPTGALPGQARHNLPAELTSFVGREDDISRLAARLASARLLTMVGPGGVGKTRLALQVASRVLDRYPDGIWRVELAPLSDGSMVPNAVAAVLGIREQPRVPLLETLAATLSDKQSLLVLDNCEHLAAGCAELAHVLLEGCPRLTILATSREPLRVAGEIRWPIPPLSVVEAVQLFVDRARAVEPDFELTPKNADPLAGICARLDGFPLAIELAAARTRLLRVHGLQRQLASTVGGLPVLTGGPRDAPARHQTLRDTIAWSYHLLDANEQTMFRRLAPFHGFSLEAATTVCVSPSDGPGRTTIALPPLRLDPREGLASLVDKSLLRVEEDAEGQPWFAMLETVREFALERLEASGESAAVWRRHALYCLRFVEQLEPGLQDLPQRVFADRVEREHANCRASLDWCQAQGYAEPSLRLGVGLWWFWAVQGHVTEGLGRLDALLARFPLRPDAGRLRAILHAKALGAAGRLAMLRGDFAAARPRLEDAMHLAQVLGDPESLSVALEGLAYLALQQGDDALARTYLERRLATVRALASSTSPVGRSAAWQTATAFGELGYLAIEQGDFEAAATQFEEARRLAHQLGDGTIAGLFDVGLGSVAHDAGDYERARRVTERGLALLESTHDRRGVAIALANLGRTLTAQREFAAAYGYLRRSLAIWQELREPGSIAFVLDRFAVLASAQGQPSRALRLAGAASSLRNQAGLTLPARIQLKLDEKLEPARRALGPLAETSLAAGRSLPFDTAIAEALATSPPDRSVGGAAVLSRREREVATLIGRGYTNRQIAAALVIGQGTVATHVGHILARLGLGSRSQVSVWAAQHGLLDEPPHQR